jgi:phosphoglycolate phosphatase-like HAD superfamily hydrolase
MIAASSANPNQLRALLKAAGVEGLLTEAASAEEVSSSKPAPDIVHAALDKIGLPADRVLMLGDTIYDLQAATESGVKMIALRCGGSKDQALMGAAAIYDHPQDLLNHWKESPLAVL